MIKLTDNISIIKQHYEPLKMEFLFNSIIEELTPGAVFVNDMENPTLSIVFEGSAIYFGGKSKTPNDYLRVIQFVKEKLDQHDKIYYLKLIYTSDTWKHHLLQQLDHYEMKVFERQLYQHSLKTIPQVASNEVSLHSINQNFLNQSIQNKADVIDEITGGWGTLEKFYQHGFGCCAVKDNKIIGWCTSEYMSKTQCGLGIETIEDYQKQGVGYLTASYALMQCKKRELIPHWDSWAWNIPSVKLAEKCLFTKINEYETILLKSKNL